MIKHSNSKDIIKMSNNKNVSLIVDQENKNETFGKLAKIKEVKLHSSNRL
jgi:hypothetical protein